jgi:hypothetical protein
MSDAARKREGARWRGGLRLNLEAALIAILLVSSVLFLTAGEQIADAPDAPVARAVAETPVPTRTAVTGRDTTGSLRSSAAAPLTTPSGPGIPLFDLGNDSIRPYYVEQVTAERTDNGSLSIYFTLRNASREVISANGTVKLSIVEAASGTELYSLTSNVNLKSFTKENIGKRLKHETLLFRFPDIAPTQFTRPPSAPQAKLMITFFTVDGRIIKGEELIEF